MPGKLEGEILNTADIAQAAEFKAEEGKRISAEYSQRGNAR